LSGRDKADLQRGDRSAGWTIAGREAGERLDAWLAGREEVASRSRAREWIERGKVFLNGHEVTFEHAGERLRQGDQVRLWMDRPGTSQPRSRDIVALGAALRVVFEDEHLVVLDKTPGMLVEPLPGETGEVTLADLVADHLRNQLPARALVVHRIDRDTSGLVLFAKHEKAQLALKRQFERRTADRTYIAVLSGALRQPEATWTDTLVWDKARLAQRVVRPGEETVGKQAIARVRALERFGKRATLVEVRLVTGKRNQIRVQAALRHHPLVGERFYARPERSPLPFERQALHAASLAVRHPATGIRRQFSAPLPPDMRDLVARLRALA
jgi:23S rRNA pseudouridine1911/1915/1917 synthase